MSQNLTQPEEIEHVLMEMAGHSTGAAKPIPDEAQSSGTIGFEYDEPIGAAGFSCGVERNKLLHSLRNP